MNRLLSEIHRTVQRLRERPQRVEARRRRRILHAELLQHFVAEGGLTVRSGPFAGMEYLAEASWVGFFPRLLGIYEEELHEVVERAIAAGPERVIDIGSAEGYYAAGLARRLPGAHVHAFDIDENARRLCAQMAERNGVRERVSVEGRCGWEELNRLVGPRTLLVSDCEGAELQLLDPERVPALRHCLMLVELHDGADRAHSTTIRRRFEPSHEITIVSTAATPRATPGSTASARRRSSSPSRSSAAGRWSGRTWNHAARGRGPAAMAADARTYPSRSTFTL